MSPKTARLIRKYVYSQGFTDTHYQRLKKTYAALSYMEKAHVLKFIKESLAEDK
jgi:hypothetical protein